MYFPKVSIEKTIISSRGLKITKEVTLKTRKTVFQQKTSKNQTKRKRHKSAPHIWFKHTTRTAKCQVCSSTVRKLDRTGALKGGTISDFLTSILLHGLKKTISKKNQRLQKELVSFTFAIIRLKLFLMGFEPMRTHNATGPTYRNFLSKTLTNNRICMNVGHLLDSCKKTSASSTRDSKKYEYFEHILIDLSIKRWIC